MPKVNGIAVDYSSHEGSVAVRLADGRMVEHRGRASESKIIIGGAKAVTVLVLSLLLLVLSLWQIPPWGPVRGYGFAVEVAVIGIDLALAFAAFMAATMFVPRRCVIVELDGGGRLIYLLEGRGTGEGKGQLNRLH